MTDGVESVSTHPAGEKSSPRGNPHSVALPAIDTHNPRPLTTRLWAPACRPQPPAALFAALKHAIAAELKSVDCSSGARPPLFT